jgi:hypothetical protein
LNSLVGVDWLVQLQNRLLRHALRHALRHNADARDLQRFPINFKQLLVSRNLRFVPPNLPSVCGYLAPTPTAASA